MSSVTKLINTKVAIGLMLGISVAIWCLILLLTGTDFVFNWKAFKHLSTAAQKTAAFSNLFAPQLLLEDAYALLIRR